jgi:hypothetical protein
MLMWERTSMTGHATDVSRLGQGEMLGWLARDMSLTEMITVYLSDEKPSHNYGIYCALIPTAAVETCLKRPTWDLMHGCGMPGAIEYHNKGHKKVSYLRFGDDKGIEPLVIDRHFHGIREDYKELSEEFRLFHRLYHDRKLDHYIKIDGDGNEHLVATVEPGQIKVRLKEIRQFLAIKEMHMAIQFDCREHSTSTLEELGLKEGGGDHRKGLACWGLHYGDIGMSSHRAYSRLIGKRLIIPLPKEKSGFWGYAAEEEKKTVDFIVGISDDGEEVMSNIGKQRYLTPVHFRKTVLDKYYQKPGKYLVEDAYLQCGSLWGMYLDNHHDDKVCAWLGDLWRDLPYHEQLHWRSHNIVPFGGMSETFIRRQIDAEVTDSDRPEHVFQERYAALATACDEALGWLLLLPLAAEDRHHFQCVRVPATDEQRDFDEVILGLTKILIDSLNENALNQLVPVEKREGLKGSISRLEAAFATCGVTGSEKHVKFLRSLQELRSSGAAHRKGSNYRKVAVEFEVDSQSLRTVFGGVLRKGLELLDYLTSVVRSGKLATKTGT